MVKITVVCLLAAGMLYGQAAPTPKVTKPTAPELDPVLKLRAENDILKMVAVSQTIQEQAKDQIQKTNAASQHDFDEVNAEISKKYPGYHFRFDPVNGSGLQANEAPEKTAEKK